MSLSKIRLFQTRLPECLLFCREHCSPCFHKQKRWTSRVWKLSLSRPIGHYTCRSPEPSLLLYLQDFVPYAASEVADPKGEMIHSWAIPPNSIALNSFLDKSTERCFDMCRGPQPPFVVFLIEVEVSNSRPA